MEEQGESANLKVEHIANLKNRRSILKGQLTRFETFLNNTDRADDKTQLEIRLQKVETAFEEFDSLQTNLEILDNTEEIYRCDLENRYYDTIARAKRILKDDNVSQQQNTSSNQFSNFNMSFDPSNNIKLPSIRLPIFAGDYQSWPTFHDTFKRLIHDNSKLNNVEKLHHLKTSLKDVAMKVIANLQITEDNYEIAWNLLIERFENKRILINEHIKAIMNLPKVVKSSSVLLRELTDNLHTHVSALEKLGLDSKSWEWVLIFIITSKLDNITDLAWEETLEPRDLPTYDNLKKFLTKRCFALENTLNNNTQQFQKTSQVSHKHSANFHSKPIATLAITERENAVVCYCCKQNHYIYRCPEFLKLTVDQKYNLAKNNKLCTNCLRPGHRNQECRSSNCRICNKNHNTLLHNFGYRPNHVQGSNHNINIESPQIKANSQALPIVTQNTNVIHESQFNTMENLNPSLSEDMPVSINSQNISLNTYESYHSNTVPNQVLLSTATILIEDKLGKLHECNALLDSGSQANIITQSLCEKLNLNCVDYCIPIGGISQRVTNIKHKTSTKIKSRFYNFEVNLSFLVLPVITANLPLHAFPKNIINYPKKLNLADENFNTPKRIDILLGAGIFYELLCNERINLGKNVPVLHATKLGWIFTGSLDLNHGKTHKLANQTICNLSIDMSNETLNQSLSKFWEVEEVPKGKTLSPEAQFAETHYRQTTTRDVDGKFIVRLPFSNRLNDLGDSHSIALKRFRYLENKFSKNEGLKLDYIDFMNEYKNLGHMSILANSNVVKFLEQPSYVLPHHAVFKQSSTTTKCRVVFDGSSCTNLNISLNDNLLIGYTVQDDLFSIVLRLRLRKYVLSADIKMMFRQIWIHPDDRNFQMILWRSDSNDNLETYTLNTVTYGTACAPFLATRTLYELAIQNEEQYPRTSAIIKTSFYMDDLLVSLDSMEEVLEVYTEITKILGGAGFNLRKWSSNSVDVLLKLLGNTDNSEKLVEFHDNKELKTLGIAWRPDTDTLNYSINLNVNQSLVTKRTVLASISRIFDPLGLVGPTIIRAKLFLQHLWRQGVEWDEPLTSELNSWWTEFSNQLHAINDISIARHVLCEQPLMTELHGFCDASERAYGTCIYLVSIDKHGNRYSNLLCAKSKVAPQSKCTLPRLELLAAVLLARLASVIQKALTINISQTRYYSDSTIVLSWLRLDPSMLKTFVGNRIAEILEHTNLTDWRHVSSNHNAADVISRGVNALELRKLNVWWYGPEFLRDNTNSDLDISSLNLTKIDDLPEIKKSTVILTTTELYHFNIFEKYSNLSKLVNIIAYCFRFKLTTLNKQKFQSLVLNPNELRDSLHFLIKLAQGQTYSDEIRALKAKGALKSSSKILCLNPFFDKSGILRVGGRLTNSPLNFDQKHPIILPKKHVLTRLIIMHEHHKNFHAGCQNLLAIIRLQYWPIDGKSTVKGVIRSCVKCFRANPKPTNFLMGDLPSSRVTPNRPFSRCGLDYCGPILIKDGTLRNSKLVKAYICIFVCFAVRAIHIELVKDLTTDSFLNALKRFISRRGKPYEIYFDNGTNFVGARNHLAELFQLIGNDDHNKRVSSFLASDQIHWRMIPSRSPHLGGIWESAVKSTKFHLKRILGDASITYEETYTILTQIEACLNSRPLSPLSVDPLDYLPLTPAHFLIGDSLAAMPQEDMQSFSPNRLTRYHRMQQLLQQFWSRWSREYLNTLQVRSKWKRNPPNSPEAGDLVILVEDNTPPLRWPMARISEVHLGKDNCVRVVSVKVPNGNVFKRSVAKICLLPIEDNVK